MKAEPIDVEAVRRKSSAKFMAELDMHELAIRLLEAESQATRPAGKTAHELIAEMDPEVRSSVLLLARTALEYVREAFADLKRVS